MPVCEESAHKKDSTSSSSPASAHSFACGIIKLIKDLLGNTPKASSLKDSFKSGEGRSNCSCICNAKLY